MYGLFLRFVGSGLTGTLVDLMSKYAIRANISQYQADIGRVHSRGLDFVWG